MILEPFFHGLRVAIGQEIDDIAPLQIDDDGAVAMSFAPRPIVDADESGRRFRLIFELLDAPQQRVRAGCDGQAYGEPRAWLAAEGATNRLVSRPKEGGCTSIRRGKPW